MQQSRLQWFLSLAVVFLSVIAVHAQTLSVKPDDAHLQYVGRFTSDHTFGWTGSSIRCRFVGTDATAKLTTFGKKVTLQIVIDGKPTDVIYVTPDTQDYVVAKGLAAGEHTLELFQRTEAYFGQTRFDGLELSAGAKLLPVPMAKHKLMVLGDSITCAYGSEEADRSKGNTAENENGYMSYAAITARQVDADIMMICWSGRGIYRNRNMKNDRENTIPVLFDQVLPLKAQPVWDMNSYKPDVVVINLGTNDLHRGKEEKSALTQEEYLGAYRQMIKKLKDAYPEVQIFACIGPMAQKPITEWLPVLDREYDYVHFVDFPGYGDAQEDIGGHWHPANSKHQKMADQLAGEIRKVMKW